MTCNTCENRMCKDVPLFIQERIVKDCLDNGRKFYLPPIKKTCGKCTHFIGMGDWNLCCDIKHPTPKEKEQGLDFYWGHLCYEDTKACDMFEEKGDVE